MENETLLHNLVLFGRVLRGLGLAVNPNWTLDLTQALDHIQIGDREDFYYTLRCMLVNRQPDLILFDAAFQSFWRKPSEKMAFSPLTPARRETTVQMTGEPPQSLSPPPARPSPTEPDIVLQATFTYSDRERLRTKDFAQLTEDELAALKRMMGEFTWRLGQRRTRRWQAGNRPRIDLRRTLRGAIRSGGEVMAWARRKPKTKPRPLVVLADISGSMEKYTRILMHFLYSLASGRTEAFVFSARLTRITRQLRGRDVDKALREVSRRVPDWSGGTRIGEALKAFNFDWGRRVLGRGAVTLLISDGWDRGDVHLLGGEMARLARSSHRLIWLNPHLGSPDYEPLTRGMQAALPHVDDFLPVHNLESLEDLALHLGNIS